MGPLSKLKQKRLPSATTARSNFLARRQGDRRPPKLSCMPYDIVWLISKACHSPEDVAALSLTNEMMYYFLKGDVTPAVAGYVAIYSLSVENILRVYRLRGPESLYLGLSRKNPLTQQYALQRVIDTDNIGVFDLISRFITHADPLWDTLLEHIIVRQLIVWPDAVIPYLSTEQIHVGLKIAVYNDLEPFARKLLSSLPADMHPSACDGLMLEKVVVYNLRNVRALVMDHVLDATFSGGIHTVLSNNRPSNYTAADICDVVRRLLAAGYPADLILWRGRSLLHHLASNGPETINFEWEYGPLPVACMPGGRELHLFCTRALIAAGADVDMRDNAERTPIFIAVRRGETVMVSTLITAGADVYVTDDAGTELEDVERYADRPTVKECVRLIEARREELEEVPLRAMRELEDTIAIKREKGKADESSEVPRQIGPLVRKRKERTGLARRAVATAGPSTVTAGGDVVAHETEEATIEPLTLGKDVQGPRKNKKGAKAAPSGHRPVTRALARNILIAQTRTQTSNDHPATETSVKMPVKAQRRVQPPRKAKKNGNR